MLRAVAAACPDGGEPGAIAWAVAEHARGALRETTGQLEVLASNGVVDAGAAGLCVVLETLAAVASEEFPETYEVPRRTAPASADAADLASHEPDGDGHGGHSGGGYEVMYLLDADEAAVPELRAELDLLGDSLVVVGGEGLWNVHVHTDDAGPAIEAGIRAGRPHRIRVTYLQAPADRHARNTGRGVVTVTLGEGLTVAVRAARRHVRYAGSPAARRRWTSWPGRSCGPATRSRSCRTTGRSSRSPRRRRSARGRTAYASRWSRPGRRCRDSPRWPCTTRCAASTTT